MIVINSNGYLRHYGILGMKWGRRNGPKTTASKPKKTSLVKSAFKEVWKEMSTVEKTQFVVGATVATAMLAANGADLVKNIKKGNRSIGKNVTYSVLDEFGKTILKSKTGVLMK